MSLHIVYSNHYDVLKARLLHALSLETKDGRDLVFDPIEIVTSSKEVDNDLRRSLVKNAESGGVCLGYRFERLEGWLEPYETFWMGSSEWRFLFTWEIFYLLKEKISVFPEGKDKEIFKSLVSYLNAKNRSDASVYELSHKISEVFAKYINYRFDWVMEWLGIEKIGNVTLADVRVDERQAMRDGPSRETVLWQKRLFEMLRDLERSKLSDNEWQKCGYLDRLTMLPESAMPAVDQKPVYVFLPRTIPPLALPAIANESQYRDIYLYVFNPCFDYWFDTSIGGIKGGDRDTEAVNKFLFNNAKSTRALINRLHRVTYDSKDTAKFYVEENEVSAGDTIVVPGKAGIWEDFSRFNEVELKTENSDDSIWLRRTPRNGREKISLLDAIINSVAKNGSLKGEDYSLIGDTSFRVAKASSTMREVEGLVDWINALKSKDPELRGEDILVVTPDITSMTSKIRAVLDSLPVERRIAYKIVGEMGDPENAAVAVGDFLYSRAGFDDFVSLFSLPQFARNWKLTGEEIKIISNWLATAGFKCGINPAHVDRMIARGHMISTESADREILYEGTLERALERLSLGFAYSPESKYLIADRDYDDVNAMTGAEGNLNERDSVVSRPELFNKLLNIHHFLSHETLSFEDGTQSRRKWGDLGTEKEWLFWAQDIANYVFSDTTSKESQSAASAFRSAYAEVLKGIRHAYGENPVTFDAFWGAVKRSICDTARPQQREGCVTFAGMRDFRHLPFKAVAMIGMDESSSFPGESSAEEFDLTMALRDADGKPCRRRGDRDSRTDNRNLFLDLMLSTGKNLLISYNAGDRSAPMNPCVIVQELLQWLESEGVNLQTVVYELPATKYSSENFKLGRDENTARFFLSVDKEALAVAQADQKEKRKIPKFIGDNPESIFGDNSNQNGGEADPLKKYLENPMRFSEFCDVWLNPSKYILGKLKLRNDSELQEDSCVGFDLNPDGLFQYGLKKVVRENVTDDVSKAKATEFFARDPRCGYKPLRRENLEGVFDTNDAYIEARRKALEGQPEPKTFIPGLLTLNAGEYSVKLRLPELEAVGYPKYDGFVLLEALSKSQKKRYSLMRLALIALDEYRSVLIAEADEFEDKDKDKETDIREKVIALAGTDSAVRAIDFYKYTRASKTNPERKVSVCEGPGNPNSLMKSEATEILEGIAKFVVETLKRLIVSPGDKYDETTPLWFGRESQAELKNKLMDSIKGSWFFGTKEVFSRLSGRYDEEGNKTTEFEWFKDQIEKLVMDRETENA